MDDHLFDVADLSEAHIMEDQRARDVRWRMWAIDRAIAAYGDFNDGTDTFYTYEFFEVADRIYRWVAKLDDTAIVFGETDPLAPTSMAEAAIGAMAIADYRIKQAMKDAEEDATECVVSTFDAPGS